MTFDGLKPDLSVDMNDPRNARYLSALDNDENLARAMADVIYSVMLDDLDDNLTTEQDVMVYCQCLVNARRMLLDPDYEALVLDGC
jgi:hypothetical protein